MPVSESSRPVAKQKVKKGVKRKAVADVVELGDAKYRTVHEVVVSVGCPAPFESFDAAEPEFGGLLTKILHKRGYVHPTPIQAQAWPVVLQGRDLVAIAKAGSGKTCGFLLPALARLQHKVLREPTRHDEPAKPSILIMAPTRELTLQIAADAKKFAKVAHARIATLYGGVSKEEQVTELKDGADLVIATPGRLMDFSEGSIEKGRRPLIAFSSVTYLVLDEADRMLDMGFGPDMKRIVAKCPPTGEREQGYGASGPRAGTARQTLFFTATWPEDVQKTAASMTSKDAAQVRIAQGAIGDKLTANSDVAQVVYVMQQKDKFIKLVHLLDKELGRGETAIVFVKAQKTCELLEAKLYDTKEDSKFGTWCRGIHAGKEQWEREDNLTTFRRITSGKDITIGRRGILVATDVAARGLDIPGVAIVVVYDFSGGNTSPAAGAEAYVHRIGRTGRAGKTGKAFTFFTPQDAAGAEKFIKLLEHAKQDIPSELHSLAKASKPSEIIISPAASDVAANSEPSGWVQRLDRRLELGLAFPVTSTRAAKRARQKVDKLAEEVKPAQTANEQVRTVKKPTTPAKAVDDDGKPKKKCKHKRHRQMAQAAKAGAETVKSDEPRVKKTRHKRARLALKKAKEGSEASEPRTEAKPKPDGDDAQTQKDKKKKKVNGNR